MSNVLYHQQSLASIVTTPRSTTLASTAPAPICASSFRAAIVVLVQTVQFKCKLAEKCRVTRPKNGPAHLHCAALVRTAAPVLATGKSSAYAHLITKAFSARPTFCADQLRLKVSLQPTLLYLFFSKSSRDWQAPLSTSFSSADPVELKALALPVLEAVQVFLSAREPTSNLARPHSPEMAPLPW